MQHTIAWHEGPRDALRTSFELAEDSAERLDAYLGLGRVLAARDERGDLAGHLQLIPTAAAGVLELKSMAVRPDLQGQGLGRALIEHALAACRAEHVRAVTVTTATADAGNIRFYQRCGFRPASIDRDAFVAGYPPGIVIDGIPLRDAISFSIDLDAPASPDVVVLGDVNPDLVLAGDVAPAFGQAEQLVDDAGLTVGGSGAITACGLARLGLRASMVGVVGDDVFGRFMLERLAGRGVDTTACAVDADRPTGISVILSRPDDRAILTHPGTIAELDASRIDAGLLARARHVHVSSYYLQPRLRADLPALLEPLREAGVTSSLDPNWDPAERWSELSGLLPLIDLLLPNAAEARALTGRNDPEQAARALAAAGPTVAVKLGAEGGLVCHGEDVYRRPPIAVAVADTTGAGDSFNAGYIAGHLAGRPPADALALAVACGSLSARSPGGTAGQPTMAEALAVLEPAT